jgi:hypothetical protein
MQKIIKLSDTHYIVVDDSEMKVGDLNIPSDCSKIADISTTAEEDLEIVNRRGNGYLKITHSTQPLEQYYGATDGTIPFVYHKIKPLSLQQVEEAIYGFNLEKDAYDLYPEVLDNDDGRVELYDVNKTVRDAYIRGFNAHKELVKDKLFTVEDMKNLMHDSIIFSENARNLSLGEYALANKEWWDKKIQSLLPKNEWECTIDEQGKITLI